MDVGEVVAGYLAAWRTTDETDRRAVLERVWAEHGSYTDPMSHLEGREALVKHIGNFHRSMDGHRLVLASGIDHHGSHLRFAWEMTGPDGGVRLDGIDFGELTDDGKLWSIVGFFGPLPDERAG